MIQSNTTEKNSVWMRVLTEDQVEAIKRAGYGVMAKVGFTILHEGARKMLKQAGCRVKGEHVKVPEHVVRACLDTTPKGYAIYSRDGERAMDVEGRNSYYGTGTDTLNVIDIHTGERRPASGEDVDRAVRLADALDHIDFVANMGSVAP